MRVIDESRPEGNAAPFGHGSNRDFDVQVAIGSVYVAARNWHGGRPGVAPIGIIIALG
jgi:hypothetical protein